MAQPQSEAEIPSHVVGLMEAFRAFDSNNDGLITTEELAGVMGSLGYDLSNQQAHSIMQKNDKNNDGLLTLTEFLEFNTKEMDLGNMAMILRVAVQDLDMDADESVTAAELFEVIQENGKGLSMTTCQQLIGYMDTDSDGAVSFSDFQLIVNSLL